MRLIAGPGSGKTATLTARCAALVAGGGAPAWRLLVITFTNKAAGELKRRLALALGEEAARQVAAGTFHSLSARLLRRYASRLAEAEGEGAAAAAAAANGGGSTGTGPGPQRAPPRWAALRPDFTVYDEGDASDVLERALKALGPSPGLPPARPAEIRWQISQVKSHCPRGAYGVPGAEAVARALASSAPLARALASAPGGGGGGGSEGAPADPRASARLARAFDAYGAALDADGALDFDDLLGAAVALLERVPDVRAELNARWRHVLVDEFQDTNAPQYRLVRLLLSPDPRARLFCVGDPCQGVYSFRGADPRNLAAAFERDFALTPAAAAAAAGAAGATGAAGAGAGAGEPFGGGAFDAPPDGRVATMALRRNHRSVDAIVRAAERVLCGCGSAPGLHSAAEAVRGDGGGGGGGVAAATAAATAPPRAPTPGALGERYRVLIDPHDDRAAAAFPAFSAAPVTLVEAPTGAGEVAAVVDAARRWRAAGEPLGEFAVLYRYRAQARDLEESLARAGVACVVHGGTALWARREVRDALAMLRLAARAGGGGAGASGSGSARGEDQAGDSQALRRLLTGIKGLALTAGLGPKAVASLQQAAEGQGVSLAALVLEGGGGGGDAAAAIADAAATACSLDLARLLWDDLARASAAAAPEAISVKTPMAVAMVDPAEVAARLERAAPSLPPAVALALRTAPQRASIARVRGLVAVVRAALDGGDRCDASSPFPLAPDEALDLALHAAGYHAWLAALREKERQAAAAAAGTSSSSGGGGGGSSPSSLADGNRERSLDVLASVARNPETYAQAAEQELFFAGGSDEQQDAGPRPQPPPPPPPWEEFDGDDGDGEDGNEDGDGQQQQRPACAAATAAANPPHSSSDPIPRGLDALVAFVDFAALMSDPHNDTPDDDGSDEEEEEDEEDEREEGRPPPDAADDAERARRARRRRQRRGSRRVDARDAVQLMTLHASKGREFAHVAMVGVEEGTLPALPPGEALPLRAGEDAWEEEKRLCYVGMTRARDHLMVSWARARRAWGADGARLLRAAAAAEAAAAAAAAAERGAGSTPAAAAAAAPPRNPYAGGGGLVQVERSPFVVALLQGAKSGALRGVEFVRAPSIAEGGGGGWWAGGGRGGGGGGGSESGGGGKKWGAGRFGRRTGWQQQQQKRASSSSSSPSSTSPAPPPTPPAAPRRRASPAPPPPLPLAANDGLPAPRRSTRGSREKDTPKAQQ